MIQRDVTGEKDPLFDNGFSSEGCSMYFIINFGDYKDGYLTVEEVIQHIEYILVPQKDWAGYHFDEVRVFQEFVDTNMEYEYSCKEFLEAHNAWDDIKEKNDEAQKKWRNR